MSEPRRAAPATVPDRHWVKVVLPFFLFLRGLGACAPGQAGSLEPDADGTHDLGAPDAGGPDPPGLPAVYGTCGPDGWCWENQLPQGYNINTMWVFSPTDAWAAGERGLLMHWDGSKWSATDSSARTDISTLWGSGPKDLWALSAAGQTLHWDGTAWSDRQPAAGQVVALWGSGASEVWVLALDGTALRWDGAAYRTMGTGAPSYFGSIVGSGPNDVWIIAGADRVVLPDVRHWDGTKLTRFVSTGLQASGYTGPALKIWPIAANDAWAVGGASGEISHWDGTAFHVVAHPPGSYVGVWASGAKDVWFASDADTILRWDGTLFSKLISPSPLRGTIHATGASDLWLTAKSSDNVVHWNGVSLEAVSIRPATQSFLSGAAGSSSSDVWLFGWTGLLRHWDGATVAAADSALTRADIKAIWVAAADDIWAADASLPAVILRRQGGTWRQVPHTLSAFAAAIGGTGPNDLWLVGNSGTTGTIEHWDGHTLRPVPTPTIGGLQRVWASSPTDAWAGGPVGILLHWDGAAWTQFAGDVSFISGAIWGSAPTDVWFGSTRSLLYHWDGRLMTTVPAPSGGTVSYLWGAGAADAWGATGSGTLHFDGTAWTAMPAVVSGQQIAISSLWGKTASDFWALGYTSPDPGLGVPAVFRWDGSSWRKTSGWLPDTALLAGTGTDLWAVGSTGRIFHRSL